MPAQVIVLTGHRYVWAAVVVGLLVVGSGALLLVRKRRRRRLRERMDEFEPVQIRVLHSEVGEKESASVHGSRHLRTIHPDVYYEYTVDGERYENDTVFPGGAPLQETDTIAEAVVGRYDEGATQMGYYDPADPSVAFLEKDPPEVGSTAETLRALATVALGLVVVAVSLYWLLVVAP